MKKLMVIVAAMAMLASSAYAADWNFYGSARMTTFYTTTDFNTAGVDDNTNLNHSLQGNARIGANVKVSDELTGRFEYGTGVNVRILYGEWNFGAGKLLVGQTYSPLNMFYSNQVYGSDNDLLNFGGVYGGRNAMVQFKFDSFKIAFLQPRSAAVGGSAVDEVVLPKIEASYRYNADNWHVALQGGYNTYDVRDAVSGQTDDVTSYIAALGAGMKFGAAYVNANIWMGQNSGNYGLYNSPADDAAFVGTTLTDNDELGYLLVVGYKVNDMINLEAGYAQSEAEQDTAGSVKDKDRSYYLQSTVGFAPGVFIVPEIGVIDFVETGTPDLLYYGLKWQINF